MKRISFVLCVCALLCGCENIDFLPSVQFGQPVVQSTTGSTATIRVNMTFSYQYGTTVEYYGIYYSTSNEEPGKLDGVAQESYSGSAPSSFTITVAGLNANTTYYARAFIRTSVSESVSEVITFTTNGSISVTTNVATNITESEATLSGTVQKNGNVTLQKRGLLINTNSNPTVENTSFKWEGTGVTGTYSITFQGLQSNTKYYYRAYAVADGVTVYGTIRNLTTKASTTPTQTTYNVSQIMSVYSSLGLSSGSTSTETYTVRGYVTQWGSGYPNYQNADFFIDDNANSGSTQLKCFRLTGVKDTDKRTLVVGDYVEVQNCHLMNYNGQAELKDGTFTVITAASDPSTPTKGSSVSDFIGTWSLTAYDWDTKKNVSWSNVKINTWNNSETGLGTAWVWVSGLNEGYDFEKALGEYDPTIKGLRLYDGMYFGDNTYTVEGHGDTLFYSVFRTVFVTKDPSEWHIISNGGGFNGRGEIWVTFDSNGKLNFTSPSTPNSGGYYSNGYNFVGYYSETDKLLTYYAAYMDIQLTQVSTSVSAPAKANRKTWHAPMRWNGKKTAGLPALNWTDRR